MIPRKFLKRIIERWPATTVDHTDHAELEIQRIDAFVVSEGIPEDIATTMRRQIRRKAASNGPRFLFDIPLSEALVVSGWTSRYTIGFESREELGPEYRQQFVALLESLGKGTVAVVHDD